MTTKHSIAVALAVVAALLLAACGGSDQASVGRNCSNEGATSGALTCVHGADGKLSWRGEESARNNVGSNSANATLSQILGGGRCDTSSKVMSYSNSMADVSKFSYVYPLGLMDTSHITPVDHIYAYYPQTLTANAPAVAAGTYEITSPADGRIVSVEDFRASNQYPYPDYRVVIEHSCDLYSVFIHVGELKGAAAAAANGTNWSGSIAVKGGEVIADDSAHPGFDFSTFDGTKRAPLANPASYAQAEQWKPFVVDPFPYFPDAIRGQLDQKSLRSSAPFGGRFDWDKVGTAMGNWFVQGTNGYRGRGDQTANFNNHGKIAHGYWDTHLAMAPNAVDNSAFIYSIGDWDGCPCQFMSKSNLDPATIVPSPTPTIIELVEPSYVTDSGARVDMSNPPKGYRVEPSASVAGLLVIQLDSNGTLKVEKMPGATSAGAFAGFTNAALIYER